MKNIVKKETVNVYKSYTLYLQGQTKRRRSRIVYEAFPIRVAAQECRKEDRELLDKQRQDQEMLAK